MAVIQPPKTTAWLVATVIQMLRRQTRKPSPKYHTAFDRVVTWREMANWCIQNPQGGKALDVSGREMLAIEAYAFNLHRGLPIEPGLASRQTKPIKVDYGKGFPSKPSGIGFDTK